MAENKFINSESENITNLAKTFATHKDSYYFVHDLMLALIIMLLAPELYYSIKSEFKLIILFTSIKYTIALIIILTKIYKIIKLDATMSLGVLIVFQILILIVLGVKINDFIENYLFFSLLTFFLMLVESVIKAEIVNINRLNNKFEALSTLVNENSIILNTSDIIEIKYLLFAYVQYKFRIKYLIFICSLFIMSLVISIAVALKD